MSKFLMSICVGAFSFSSLQPSLGSDGGPEQTVGGWELRKIDGYPAYSISFTANPGSYAWEATPATEDTTHKVTDGQLIGNASGNTVRAVVQGNINNDWTTGDQSLGLRVSAKAEERKLWAFVGGKDEAGIPEATFSGTASITLDVSCSGTAGYDGGYWLDPALSKSNAMIGAAWSATDPTGDSSTAEDCSSYQEDASLSVSGWADNKVNKSNVSQVAAGSAMAGTLKLFGVVINFNGPTGTTAGSLSYLHGATATARDEVGPIHVMEAANVEFGWSGTAVAETNLYSDGNTATGNAEASVTADITLHIAIPDPIDDGDEQPTDPGPEAGGGSEAMSDGNDGDPGYSEGDYCPDYGPDGPY
ncbi:MAG: hypothetical protein Fues2KO_54730 [Fuerstiella sp.]